MTNSIWNDLNVLMLASEHFDLRIELEYLIDFDIDFFKIIPSHF